VVLEAGLTGYVRRWDFLSHTDFNITGGFTGNNMVLFFVTNYGGPTGLLVTDLTVEVVPVPSAVILGSFGLTFSGWMLKKRRKL
jgi:hypothetical protein